MAYYRLLLVDDEEEVREGIIRKLDWESLGYTVVGDAENGMEALEKAEQLHPDVVMTDIKMPFMDGLELGEKLQKEMPSTKLIIFSGFDDFEYAQKAIKLNVAEYVLKPINSAELIQTLRKLRQQLDREYNEKRDAETLRRYYKESLPVLREQFLAGLMEGHVTNARLQFQNKLYDMNLHAEAWAVALVRADTAPRHDTALFGEEELIPISLKCTVDDILGGFCSFTSFLYLDCVAVIAELNVKSDVMPLLTRVNEICKAAERILGVRVVAGVGTPCASLMEIRHSYRDAQNALDYSAALGEGKAVYIADIEPETSVKMLFDEQDEREIVNAVKMEPEEAIRKKISALFERYESMHVPLSQYQIYLMEIITALLKVIQAYELNTEDVFGENINYLSTIASLRSPSEMKQWCSDCSVKVSARIKRGRIDSSKMLAQNAKQYIAEHFSDIELSVESLCGYLHVSPAYFSTVFKRETGMSFVACLTEARLQEAVNLLKTTGDKTYIIANKVGYPEPNYLSYVFKKKYGVSPSKYRSND